MATAGKVTVAEVEHLAGAAIGNAAQSSSNLFRMEFAGLFLCDYSKSQSRLLVALPDAQGHSSRIAVDLRLVDTTASDSFDVVVANPGGQQHSLGDAAGDVQHGLGREHPHLLQVQDGLLAMRGIYYRLYLLQYKDQELGGVERTLAAGA